MLLLRPILFPFLDWKSALMRLIKQVIFTKIDLLKGYWQVPLTDMAKEISAFVVPDALYACKVMPFGMKNAIATFQRLIDKVLAGLTN